MFQIKNFVSIVASMINHMRGVQRELTDFNVGSIARTLVEAPAIEMDELYQQMFNGLKEAIPVATYNSFDFERLAAVPASGLVTVTIDPSAADTLIAAGTTFSSTDAKVAYRSVDDVTILAGGTVASVLVAAATTGVVGNIPAGVSFVVAPQPAGLVSATNAAAFSNGTDEETDDQRKQRFAQYVSNLQRGTVSALEYGCYTAARYNSAGVEIERVKAVSIVEPYLLDDLQPISLVNVYIHNGAGSTSGDLVDEVEKVLHGYTADNGVKVSGWKAAGVKVVVAAATEVEIDMPSASITVTPGYDKPTLQAQVEAVLNEYLLSLNIGASYLEAEAIYRVKSIEGIVNITGLPADTTSDADEKIMPGTITVAAP